MRIGCLQFAPQVGDVDNNLNRADAVLSRANPKDLDLLVLPELAFSGYNFKSLQDIAPFLEPSGSGITSLWARTVALKHNCFVAVGYPEVVDSSSSFPSTSHAHDTEKRSNLSKLSDYDNGSTTREYYNSAIVVNRDGETIANYRKSFLYHTDETWAMEGDRGFFDGFIPELGNTSIGICMDLNPYKFEAPWHAFEFAFHILKVESNLVIVSMAWQTREERRPFSRMPNEPDMDSLTYWVTRLEPLIRAECQDEIIVVFCNRTGTEDEATYSGTSAIIGIHDGEVNVYGLLGRGEKELLVVDTDDSPYAKLVYRPGTDDNEKSKSSVENRRFSTSSDKKSHGGHSDLNLKPAELRRDNDGDASKPNGETMNNTMQNRPHSITTARSRSRGRSPAMQSPSPPRELAVLPPLPVLPDGLVNDVRKPPQSLSISIPPPPGLITADSAQSSAPDSFDIPTPSAPSPTPMAIRPKLIIPESPSSKIFEYVPDNPISAASEWSERSIQSVKSNESEASVQTVKSNPRPPEDSTPYPHSSTPLSGYPIKKSIYGGHVTVSRVGGTFTPTTPFHDVSPASPRSFWKPPDNFVRTPVSGGGWQSGTPIGRRPEPFPWPAIWDSSRSRSRSQSRNRTKDALFENESHQDDMWPTNLIPHRSITASVRAERQKTAAEALKSAMNGDPLPARPASPKSRNASRSRTKSRSDSSVNHNEAADAVSEHLESISRRAESANSKHAQADRAKGTPGEQTIHMVANSDILGGAGRPPSVGPAVADGPHYANSSVPPPPDKRSNSFTALTDRPMTPSANSNVLRHSVRTISRNCRSDAKVSPAHSDPTTSRRAPSVDSVSARAFYSDFRQSSSQSLDHHGRRPSHGRRSGSNRPRQTDLSEFERVEAIICPNCPVHGSEAATSQNGNTNESAAETAVEASSSSLPTPTLANSLRAATTPVANVVVG